MTEYTNSGKDKFLASIPKTSLEAKTDKLTEKCKFNFAYFEKQAASQSFDEWSKEQLTKLLDKLKVFSGESLTFWRNNPTKSGHTLEIYGAFPKARSDFTQPNCIPHQAEWGRFRLESKVRFVGFVIPNEFKDNVHQGTGVRFDCNTFYVVFLDANHKFYKTEKP